MKYIDTDLAAMLDMSLQHLLQDKVSTWRENLAAGKLTREMRDVFVGIGWLSSSRDSRLHDDPTDVEDEDGDSSGTEPEPVEIREPEVKPGKPEPAVPPLHDR